MELFSPYFKARLIQACIRLVPQKTVVAWLWWLKLDFISDWHTCKQQKSCWHKKRFTIVELF